MSFNFMAAVILEPPQNKVCRCFHCFPIYLPWSDGTGCRLYFISITSDMQMTPSFGRKQRTKEPLDDRKRGKWQIWLKTTFRKLRLGHLVPSVQYSSVQLLSPVRLSMTPWTQHARPPCPSPTPGVHSNSCPLSQWYHPTISSSIIPFSSHP